MDSSEVEFLAEKELISIIPNFSHEAIYLISGDIGPFHASIPIQVPLWMAVNLRQRQKCRIQAPEWMNLEKLEQLKEEEKDSRYFVKLPCDHYREVAQLVLDCASDDISQADEIRTAIKDIWDLRVSKLRSSIDAFLKSNETHAKLNHLTLMELNTVRPFLTTALNQIHVLKKASANVGTHNLTLQSQDF